MNRFYFILILIGLLVSSCASNKDLDEVNARIDALENNSIASINQQISAIQKSVSNLEETDKELKGYIATLQTSAAELQKAINTNNNKIDRVETSLRDEFSSTCQNLSDDIIAAKTELLANLTSLKVEMTGQFEYVSSRIDSLKKKDVEIEAKIEHLRNYTDKEIKLCKDWAAATFATLEQYNSVVADVAEIKESISALNNSMSALETRLNDKIAVDIAAAVSSLETELQQSASEITQGYKDAVALAKGQIESAYTAAISSAITSLESSMQAWVNGRLTGYYTIAETDARMLSMQQNLEGQLNTQKTYFETMIGALTGQLDAKITTNATAISKLNEDISSLSEDAAAKALLIADNASKIQNNAEQIKNNAIAIQNNAGKISVIKETIEAETADIRAKIEENKAAIVQNAALIAQNEETIRTANLSISAQDVANNAAAIASNASLIAQNAEAIADNQSAIEANASDIAGLRSDLESAKTEITSAYQTSISTAIANLDGKITGRIADEVATINANMNALEGRVNAKITALKGRVDTIEEEIAAIHLQITSIISDIESINLAITKLINRIQSVSFIPKYTDGMATMEHGTGSGNGDVPTLVVDLEIQPHEAVDAIVSNPSVLSFRAVPAEVRTKAASMFTVLDVKQITKKEDGVITVTITCENLDTSLLTSGTPIHVAAVLSNDNANYTSPYFAVNMDAYYPNIRFEDPYVKAICVANWDADEDGELSYDEAAAVTSVGGEFYNNAAIRVFNEFKYFSNLKELRDSAFYKCINLCEIELPSSLQIIKNATSDKCGVLSYTALQKIQIPASVISIGVYAFNNNILLSSVSFEKASMLTTLGPAHSGNSAPFYGCNNMVLFDASECKFLTNIGDYFFWGKEKAKNGCVFKFGSETPPELGYNTMSFYGAQETSWMLYVPSSSIAQYAKADGWKRFSVILPL